MSYNISNTVEYGTGETNDSGINDVNVLLDTLEVDRLLWIYWSPFTFFLGLVGNILVIKIFGFSKSTTITTTSTTSIYFTVMAVADVTFLIFGIVPEWLDACNFIKLQEVHYMMCKLEKFIFYLSGDVAIWIICINTMDRFIAVCFPFTQQSLRKAVYAKIASLVTFIVAIVKNMHVFWTRGPVYTESGDVIKVCGRPEPYTHFEVYVRPWIAFVLVGVVPVVLLSVFNVFIIRFLIKEMRKVRATGKKHQPDFTQTICMCVAVSLAFLVFITPSLILYIGKPYWSHTDNATNHVYDVSKAVGNQLSYVNHAINFLLYCITAKKFREEAIKLIIPKKYQSYCYSKKNKTDEEGTNWRPTIRRSTLKRETKEQIRLNNVNSSRAPSKTDDNSQSGKTLLNKQVLTDQGNPKETPNDVTDC